MSTQTSREARDVAIDQVEANADKIWRREAERALVYCAMELDEFTADDVWAKLTESPREPRALGAVMRYAYKMDIIEPTETWKITARVSSHARPLRVWKSLLRSAK
jgi:hypothetical protein